MKITYPLWSRVALVVCSLLVALPAFAQNPTGTLTGRVSDPDGEGLPGVTVSVNSPALQGTRGTVSGTNGDYKLGFLPAGVYEVHYELEGFNTVVREMKLNAAQTSISDVRMQLSAVAEEIVVQGNLETISESPTIATTIQQDELESLAVARNVIQAVDLVPGVHRTGPVRSGEREGNVTISGSMSFENLWLVNGVVINENLRGQPLSLFIEDAVQEQTALTGNVSAEYGRFTGGVVNVLTKSGGNNFHGSIRDNFANQDWESRTPLTAALEDKVNETYEATFGGRLVRDRAWFFLAGRDRELDELQTTSGNTNLSFPEVDEQSRYEGKLTLNLTQSHSLVGSYLEIEQATVNDVFGDPVSLRPLTTRSDPQELWAVNYNGVYGSKLFLEAQHSERDLGIAQGAGGPRDLINGSPIERVPERDFVDGPPWFCGECENEVRNNENSLIKASYFLSTESAGTHDIAFGYDTFKDVRFSVNHQAGNDITLGADAFLIDPATNEAYPVFDPNGSSWVAIWPVFGLDRVADTDFNTNSFFVNDRWQLSEKWSFNLGARYDENDGRDAGGSLVADDSKLSPRVGVTYDLRGDGDMVFNASAGRYVAAVANSRANAAATGGALGLTVVFWGDLSNLGINTDPNCIARGDCVSTSDAIATIVQTTLDQTGFNPFESAPESIAGIPNGNFLSVPGTESNTGVTDSVKSPSADELTFGVTKRLGTKGLVRADLVYRDWTDFYSDRTTVDTPPVSIGGVLTDFREVGNFGNDKLSREYIGLHAQARYRLTPRLTLAGSYALSELEGNIDGETTGSGPISLSPNRFPELKAYPQNVPVGDLGADQRHKFRGWAVYQLLQGDRHNLSVSWLQTFNTGTPYGGLGAIDNTPFQAGLPYIAPDPESDYWFTSRDAFRTDDITSSDIALNYSFRWNAFGKAIEVFIQPEILNLFDEEGVLAVDTELNDNTTDGSLAAFNPFADTPVQGTNFAFGDNFGQPSDENDFQTPRTFRFSVGFRF